MEARPTLTDIAVGHDSNVTQDEGQRLLLRDSLKLLQGGAHSDFEIQYGPRSWDVHKAIVLERSTWLRDRVANTNACGMILEYTDEPDAQPAPCIFGAFLAWLYTRSFTLVEENINSGIDEDNRLVSFVGLLHFMMRTNLPRLGSEDANEWDNDEAIQFLGGTILRLLKEVIDHLVLSDIMEQLDRTRCFHIVAQALEWLYHRDYHWYQGSAAPLTRLRQQVVVHLASRGPLVKTDLKEEWEKMLNTCEGLHEERLESVATEDETVGLMDDELVDWYQGS